MEHQGIIISCMAIVAIVVIAAVFLRRRSAPARAEVDSSTSDNGDALATTEQSRTLFQFEESLPLSYEEERIVRIEDGRLLAEIDRTIPVAAQVAVNANAAAKVGKAVEAPTSKMIRRQRRSLSTAETADSPDLYQADVTLIMRDGAVYYLPPA